METKMKLTLKSGETIEGTPAQIEAISKSLTGDTTFTYDADRWYMSSKRGLVEIKKMPFEYLRNAFLRKYLDWVENLRELSITDMVTAVQSGPVGDPQFVALLKELVSRRGG